MGGGVLGKQTEMTKSIHALCAASSIVLMGAATAGPARAEALTAGGILSNFNLVTTGNVSTQSDIVGDAVVGGDLSGATFFGGGSHIPASPTLYLFGAEQLAEPQLGRQSVLCGLLESEDQL